MDVCQIEDLQVSSRYKPGQKYDYHVDGLKENHKNEYNYELSGGGQRIYTIFTYLNT